MTRFKLRSLYGRAKTHTGVEASSDTWSPSHHRPRERQMRSRAVVSSVIQLDNCRMLLLLFKLYTGLVEAQLDFAIRKVCVSV